MDTIYFNADITQAAVVDGAAADWVASPTPGIERKILEREGGEVAVATSIVRYLPGSWFPPHTHGGGEEFLVLEGTFSDEHGNYGPLTYVRNPPGSRHSPGSEGGCTIFVKLRQMGANEVVHTVVDASGPVPEQVLHRGSNVVVELHRLEPGTTLQIDARNGGEELFVVEGAVQVHGRELGRWCWLRRPAGDGPAAVVSKHGAIVWLKRGHLDRMEG